VTSEFQRARENLESLGVAVVWPWFIAWDLVQRDMLLAFGGMAWVRRFACSRAQFTLVIKGNRRTGTESW